VDKSKGAPGTNELIGAMGDFLRVLFWNFNGIFYSIISSISSKLVQKNSMLSIQKFLIQWI
jgi:hypothetical protein